MTVAELERAITQAHAAGDIARVARLQAEYRTAGHVERINRGGITVTRAADAPAQGSSVSRSPDRVPVAVRLTGEARRQLAEVEFDDDQEVGGFLYGTRDGDEIGVHEIRGADWDTGFDGERHHVRMDGDFAVDREHRFESVGLKLAGLFHTHPHTPPTAPLRLSRHDEREAARTAAGLKQPWAMLLLGPGDPDGYGGWLRPRMRAWLVHRDTTVREADLNIEERTHGY